MQIYPIRPVGFAANAYCLTEDGTNAVVIDPAQPSVLREAEKRGLFVRFALLTHGHFDHIGGCAALQERGAKIGCLRGEVSLARGRENMGEAFGVRVPPFSVDFTLSDGETVTLCGMEISVMGTPGHTAGSCCLLVGDALFSGDTLFCRDCGRTDLPTGSETALRESLRRLARLPNRTVYPGHGMPTTLQEEKLYGVLHF